MRQSTFFSTTGHNQRSQTVPRPLEHPTPYREASSVNTPSQLEPFEYHTANVVH